MNMTYLMLEYSLDNLICGHKLEQRCTIEKLQFVHQVVKILCVIFIVYQLPVKRPY